MGLAIEDVREDIKEWFSLTEVYYDGVLSVAECLFDMRNNAHVDFSPSGDWIFYIQVDGKLLSMLEIAKVDLESLEILANKFGD